MSRALCLLLLALVHGLSAAQPQWHRVEVPFAEPVELRSFGGPDVTVSVQSNEMTTFRAVVSDRGDLVPKLVANGYGGFDTVLLPRGSTRVFEKKNGIPVDGRLSEAYLVYHDPASGVRAYFYDTLDSKQNHCVLLIVPGREPPPIPEVLPENPGPDAIVEPAIGSRVPPPQSLAPDPSETLSAPAWSLIGNILLYQGTPIADDVRVEARRWGLDRELYIQERTWIEKERQFGTGRTAEYAALAQRRQHRRPRNDRTAIQKMRDSLLAEALHP